MARTRKETQSAQADEVQSQADQAAPEQEQTVRESARAEAGQANQDQVGAPPVEQQPQPDTRRFVAQPDVVNAPVADEEPAEAE